MTGSVVGSPIHMAPELITGIYDPPAHILDNTPSYAGKYDHSVDVYAFGVLFWYVCSGSVVLPLTFQKCSNKDKLWSAVKKGDLNTWQYMHAYMK